MKIKTALIILLTISLVMIFFVYLYSTRINMLGGINLLKKKAENSQEQSPANSSEEIMQKEAAERAASEQRRTEIMDSLKAQTASNTPVEDPKVVEKKINAMKKMLLK